ncbi:MAG: DUF1501 domain-containing protein [Planctomycetota bacterium]|nr:DUF1501 domain-containing protein [Planctomycetota bacterium]
MLTIWGKEQGCCDGLARREFLKLGGLGAGALSLNLADILKLQAEQSPAGRSASGGKSVIMIFLPGGPPHMDMYDMKPDAPVEYRGELSPIGTNVDGARISELFPLQAGMMDKLSVLRSVVGMDGSHSGYQFMTAYRKRDMRPALGSVVSKLGGPGSDMPPYVSLNRRNEEQAAYLGPQHGPFQPSGPALNNMKLPGGLKVDRFQARRGLLAAFDRMRRDADASGAMEGMDGFSQRAFDMISSGTVRQAFDIKQEDPGTVAAYGKGGQRFLMARRLVEAGVKVVTLSFGGWDTHSKNFVKMRQQLPELDQALHALITDLEERGLLDDVAIAMWGEFGRTPKVNKKAGRDHWPKVMSALFAGGGLRHGQVIGATNPRGEYAIDGQVTEQNLHATLYRVLGINPEQTFMNNAGRPTYLLDDREVVRELF